MVSKIKVINLLLSPVGKGGGNRTFAALCLEVRFELSCATTLVAHVTPPYGGSQPNHIWIDADLRTR